MWLEATGNPFIYRWPGGEVKLEQGKPIDLPEERAKRLLDKAPGKVRVVSATIQAGSLIIWTRVDGTTQTGLVDVVHVDVDGRHWAFVALGDTWSAVNCKFVKVVTQ